jgi:O-antigen/teichoic acid export membrane protein
MNHTPKFRPIIRPRLGIRRQWRDTGLLLTADMIVVALALGRLPIITRILAKDEVGLLAVVGVVLPFLQLLSLSGLDGAAYHYMAKGSPGAFRTNIALRLRWSLLTTLGFLVGAVYWLSAGNSTLAWLFVIAAAAFPLTTALNSASALSAREKFRTLFWYRIVHASTNYTGVAVLLLLPLLSNQVIWFSLGNKIALAGLQVGVAMWIIRRLKAENIPPLASEERRGMLSYGRHLTVLTSISTVQTRADALLVGWFLPLSVMADYSIAHIVHDQLKRIWMVYYTVRYPPLVRLSFARRRRRITVETAVMWTLFSLLALAAGLALRVLIPIVLPREYSSSLPFIYILLAAFAAGVPGFFAEMYFRTKQDERRLYIMRGVAAVSGVVLPATFIFFWGALGVAFGRLIASMTLSIVGGVLFFKDAGRGENNASTVRESE